MRPVRQVIPIIRSNDTKGTPDIDYSQHRRKRSADDAELQNDGSPIFIQLPKRSRRTFRAGPVRKAVLQSRILDKKLRFLRAAGLREIEKRRADRKTREVVPRVSYPVRIDQASQKKVSYVPRYFLFCWSV